MLGDYFMEFSEQFDKLVCPVLIHSNQNETKNGHVIFGCFLGLVAQACVKLSVLEVCVSVLVCVGLHQGIPEVCETNLFQKTPKKSLDLEFLNIVGRY